MPAISFDDLPDAAPAPATPQISFDDLPAAGEVPTPAAAPAAPAAADVPPDAITFHDLPDAPKAPDSGFLTSAGASIASNIGNTGAFLVEGPREQEKAAFVSSQTRQIEQLETGLKNFDATVAKKGFTTADDEQVRQSMVRALTAKKFDYEQRLQKEFPPEREAKIEARNAAAQATFGPMADKMREWANKDVWDLYGADPKSTNIAAQVGRGVGMVTSAVPTMGLGLPAAVVQMSGASFEQAKFAKETELKLQGIQDPETLNAAGDQAGREAFKQSTVGLGLYMIAGSLAGNLAARLAGPEASAVTKGLLGLAGSAVSNVGVGSVLRALEAPPGEALSAAVPKVENLTADTLFAVVHGFGEYGKASVEAKEAANKELVSRGFTEDETKKPAVPPAETPARELTPPKVDDEAAKEEAAKRAALLHDAASRAESAGMDATAAALKARAATEGSKAIEPPAPEPAPEPPLEPSPAAPATEPPPAAATRPPLDGPIPEIHRPEVDLINGLRAPYVPPAADEPAAPADEGGPSYSYVQPERTQNRPPEDREEMVDIKIPEFDKAWSGAESEKGFYVAPGGEGAIKGRRERFEEWLKANPKTPIETPEVSIGEDGTPSFTNGRHRYSVLRDRGEQTMKVSMDPESAARAREHGLLSDDLTSSEHAEIDAEMERERKEAEAEWEREKAEYEAEMSDEVSQSLGSNELLDVVRQLGGLPSIERDTSLKGETKRLWETNKGHMLRLVSKSQRLTLDQLRQDLEQFGFHFETPDQMLEVLEERLSSGKPQHGFETGGHGFFESKTPISPEREMSAEILKAAEKAPTMAELDAKGRQPGTIDFSRPGGAGKVTVQNTREALTALADRYRAPGDSSHVRRIADAIEGVKHQVAGVRVRIVRTEADLPADVRERLKPSAVHEGLADTDSGDVYILAGNISSPERALEVFAHEVVGHFGVEKIVEPGEWKAIADGVIDRAPASLPDLMRNYTRANKVEEMTPRERAIVAREYVARLAERPSDNPPVWRQVVQAVRNGLRALGIVREWSEADIRDLVKRGRDAVADPNPGKLVGQLHPAVRDLGSEVAEHSPYASEVERAFHEAIPSPDGRTAVDVYVKGVLGGDDDLPDLPGPYRAAADRFVQYFRTKEDFAERNGVASKAQAAYDARLAANPSLTLPERLAVYSSEVNKLIGGRGADAPKPEPGPGAGGPTSIKNAVVDQERASRGLPPAVEPARRSFGAVWDDAMARIDRDPMLPERLAKDLDQSPRPVKDWEDAVLLHRQITLQNSYDIASGEYLKAVEAGDTDTADAAQDRIADLSEKLLQVYNADKSVGTENARALNARKMIANENYTLAKMVTDKRVANGGQPLTPEQHATVFELHQRIANLEAQIRTHEATRTEQGSQQAATDAVKSMVDEVQKEAPKEKKIPAKVLDAISKKADEARARIRARRGTFNVGLNPAELLDYAIVGAEYFAKGAVSIGRFGAKLILEFGEAVRPHIPDIFAKAAQLAQEARTNRDLPTERAAIVAGMKRRTAEGDTVADLSGYVRKLALNLVRSGVTEREPLIDQVHQAVREIEPDITRRQTMDLISGYGDFKELDPEAAKVQLRDLKGQMQAIGKLEDMAAGIAPKKTGVQRREPSDVERKLIQEVNEAKKKGGFEVTDPATQLRSALAARERALTNEIKAVQEEIDTGVRRKTPAAQPTSPEVDALRTRLAQLREQRDSIFGKPEMTDEQRLKVAIDAADRSTAEYERQVKEKDFGGRKNASVNSPELEAAKARRDAARAERDEFKALDKGVRQQKEEARTRQLQESIAELDRKLRTGETDVEHSAPPVLTPEQEALVSERDSMLRLLSEIRSNPKSDSERQVERLTKQVNELDRRLKEGDIDRRTKGAVTPLTPQAERLMAIRDAQNRLLEELRADAKPKLSPAEIALKRWKSATARRLAELQDKTARGDFAAPAPRTPLALDAEGQKLAFELDKAKETFNRGRFEDMLRQRSTGKKILGTVMEVKNTAQAVMTAFDLSAVLRQGGFIVIGHPFRALRAFPAMFRAFGSERGEHAVEHEIASRPNTDLYRQSKLDLTKKGIKLSDMEEQYMSRWVQRIPKLLGGGVLRGSERAYRAFLNRLRADSFDAMTRSFGRNGKGTLEEAKAIANFINVATGRGNIGGFANAAAGLNGIIFAPRLVLSRFQLLAGQPLWSGSMATRAAITGEYARFLLGAGTVLGLGLAAGATVEKDPRSSDFGKLRFGNTRLDMFSGLLQATVFASRIASQSTKNNKGQIMSLRTKEGEKRAFGQADSADVIWRFLRTKLAPAPGASVDALSGRNVVGETVTPAMSAGRLFVPLTFGDIYTAMKDNGMPGGPALAVLVLFGAGLQSYDDKKKKP